MKSQVNPWQWKVDNRTEADEVENSFAVEYRKNNEETHIRL